MARWGQGKGSSAFGNGDEHETSNVEPFSPTYQGTSKIEILPETNETFHRVFVGFGTGATGDDQSNFEV